MGHSGKCCYWQTLELEGLFVAEGTPEFLSCGEASPASQKGPLGPLYFIWVLKLL